MTERDNPMPQTTTQGCITCDNPVRIPVEWLGKGPVKHDDCPAPNYA